MTLRKYDVYAYERVYIHLVYIYIIYITLSNSNNLHISSASCSTIKKFVVLLMLRV